MSIVKDSEECLFEVYSARCPRCGTWGVWDITSPQFVTGPPIPFDCCCLICGNFFRVNAFDSRFVSFKTRESGFSRLCPASRG